MIQALSPAPSHPKAQTDSSLYTQGVKFKVCPAAFLSHFQPLSGVFVLLQYGQVHLTSDASPGSTALKAPYVLEEDDGRRRTNKHIIFLVVSGLISLVFSFMAGGVLPGGYNYLHISKPGVPTPLDVVHDPCDHVSSIMEPFLFCSPHLFEKMFLFRVAGSGGTVHTRHSWREAQEQSQN